MIYLGTYREKGNDIEFFHDLLLSMIGRASMGMGMVNVILDFEEGLGSRWTLITGGKYELAEVISTTTISTVLEIKSKEEVELVSSQSSHLPNGANALTKLASTGPPAPRASATAHNGRDSPQCIDPKQRRLSTIR